VERAPQDELFDVVVAEDALKVSQVSGL